jgi:hypothetical protein
VNGDTLVEWAKPDNETKYPGFSAAYNQAKDLEKEFLVDSGLAGLYPPASFIFTAKNITDMRDRQEFTGAEGGAINVNLVDYRNNAPAQVPAAGLSDTAT